MEVPKSRKRVLLIKTVLHFGGQGGYVGLFTVLARTEVYVLPIKVPKIERNRFIRFSTFQEQEISS